MLFFLQNNRRFLSKVYEEAFESSLLEICVERYLIYSRSDYLCILSGKIGVKKN